MRNLESKLQCELVRWFSYQYPQYEKLLFAVPNGHKRSVITATILKKEGVKTGVSDLILLIPNASYHALCIEVKYGKGKQNENQIAFQKAVEKENYLYMVVTDFDQFQNLINSYLL